MRIDVETTGFDIDGVIADTMSLFLELVEERLRIHHWRYEDIVQYDLAKCFQVDPECFRPVLDLILDAPHRLDLKPMPGCVRTLTRLSRCAPLFLVTARAQCAPIYQWFLQTFRNVDPLTVHVEATGSADAKPSVLKELGLRFFVEDRLETCYLLAEEGITPIVYEHPWNRKPHPFVRVRNWTELDALLGNGSG